MSASSRTLKGHELIALAKAEEQAAILPNYGAWLVWMRSRCPYALAVRMAVFAGFKVPCRGFYLMLRQNRKYQSQDVTSRVSRIVLNNHKAYSSTKDNSSRRAVSGEKDCKRTRLLGV